MIPHGATIAAIFIAILSPFEGCARVADDYVLPAPRFKLLPRGIRIWIPHEEGVEFVEFDGKFFRDIGTTEVDAISAAVFSQKGKKWTFQDRGVNVRNGDTMMYWMFARVNGREYRRHEITIIHVLQGGTRLVFNETFDSLNQATWRRVIKFPLSPDFEFCVYHNADHTGLAEIVDGVFRIKPLILDHRYGEAAPASSRRSANGKPLLLIFCRPLYPPDLPPRRAFISDTVRSR